MRSKVPGLEPRGFKWVIAGKLAMSERIGGHGFQHRRVRREEEITWLKDQGINAVLTFLPSNQNHSAYEAAGFGVYHRVIDGELEPEDIDDIFGLFDEATEPEGTSLLVHRDLIDDVLIGLLGGFLVHCGLIADPVVATSVIQEISGRPLGPEGRRLIPTRS